MSHKSDKGEKEELFSFIKGLINEDKSGSTSMDSDSDSDDSDSDDEDDDVVSSIISSKNSIINPQDLVDSSDDSSSDDDDDDLFSLAKLQSMAEQNRIDTNDSDSDSDDEDDNLSLPTKIKSVNLAKEKIVDQAKKKVNMVSVGSDTESESSSESDSDSDEDDETFIQRNLKKIEERKKRKASKSQGETTTGSSSKSSKKNHHDTDSDDSDSDDDEGNQRNDSNDDQRKKREEIEALVQKLDSGSTKSPQLGYDTLELKNEMTESNYKEEYIEMINLPKREMLAEFERKLITVTEEKVKEVEGIRDWYIGVLKAKQTELIQLRKELGHYRGESERLQHDYDEKDGMCEELSKRVESLKNKNETYRRNIITLKNKYKKVKNENVELKQEKEEQDVKKYLKNLENSPKTPSTPKISPVIRKQHKKPVMDMEGSGEESEGEYTDESSDEEDELVKEVTKKGVELRKKILASKASAENFKNMFSK